MKSQIFTRSALLLLLTACSPEKSAQNFAPDTPPSPPVVRKLEVELDENYLWLKKNPYLFQMKLSDDLKRFDYIKKHSQISSVNKGIASIQFINNKIYFQTKNHFYRFSVEQDDFFVFW